ncbi:Hypothetical protein YozF [Bacillus subtilis subsp. subtilis str. BSP1]|nr:Hypothetical protein YozF [Bacillus subtilis subsp. subtilis str. BSP1]
MKRVLFSVIVFTAVGFTFCQSKAHALTFTVLPITQKTDQWSVKVSEAKNVKEFTRPQKGEYQVYSLGSQKYRGKSSYSGCAIV